jgi:esterase
MGGKVAMKYALKWPESLNSLLVLDISPFGTRDHENESYRQHCSILEALLSVDLAGLKTRSEVDNLLLVKIPSERIRSFIMKNLTRSNHKQFSWRLNARALYDNLDNIMEGIVPDDDFNEQATGFPVLFVKGENSDYIMEDDMPEIKRIFPAADLRIISNAGHWINAERPDALIRIFRDQIIG